MKQSAVILTAVLCTTACERQPAIVDVDPSVQSAVVNLPPNQLAIVPERPSIAIGRDIQLRAARVNTERRVEVVTGATWSSATPAVATVSSTGVLRGVAIGTSTITAVAGGQTATVVATVAAPPTPPRPEAVASISVSPATIALQQGAKGTLTAVVKDANGAALRERRIEWSSSNAEVAAVDAKGVVTARNAGTATITATCEGKTATAQVTSTIRPVSSITLAPASITLVVGRDARLSAIPRDAGGETLRGRVLTWSSNNTAVATVSSSGVVRAVAAGVATITASAEGKSATTTVTVTAAPGR